MIVDEVRAPAPALTGSYPIGDLTPVQPVRIALVGPDGVGKSTAISLLEDWFRQGLPKVSFEVRHWRPELLPDLGFYLGKPATPGQKTPPRRKAGRFQLIRLFYYFLDFLIGSWWKDRVKAPTASLIVYDRCALDMYVDPVRFGLKSAFGTRLLSRLTPRPDLTILLFDHPERIWARKQELARHEMADQLDRWLQLVGSGEVQAVIQVDAGPEVVAARILNLTLDAIVRKNGLQPQGEGEHGPETLRRVGDAMTGGSAYSIFSSEPQKNMLETARFAILPSEHKPRFLVPLGGRGPASKALEIYNAQTFRARAGKRWVQAGLRLGLAQMFLKVRSSLWISAALAPEAWCDSLLDRHLSQELGRPQLVYAVSIGTPNSSQKPVLQLMEPDGRIAGYTKVGWNQRTIGLVRNEGETLERLSGIQLSSAVVPRVLKSGMWRGHFLLTQSACEGTLRESPSHFDERHLRFLIELHRAQTSPRRLPWTTLSAEYSDKLDELTGRGFHYYSHLLETAAAACGRMLGNTLVPCGLGHGDFAPWNIRITGKKLLVIDWEYGSETHPPLWDLFHFQISSATELRNRSAPGLYRDVTQPGPVREALIQYCAALALPKAWIEPLLTAYLCEALHNNLILHGPVPSTKDQRSRATLGCLLGILCRPSLGASGPHPV